MVLFEFINCCLSTYGPYYIIYSGLKLGKSGASTVFYFIILLYYIITQFIKLLILAAVTRWINPPLGVLCDILEESVNVGDMVGIYHLLLQRQAQNVESKRRMLIIGIWWGLYDSLATNCLPYLMNAKSRDFTMIHIYRTASAGSFLFANLSKVCLIYLWTKYHASGISMFCLNTLLFYFFFCLPVLNKSLILANYMNIPQWSYLILQLLFTMLLSLAAKSLVDRFAIKLRILLEEGKVEEKYYN